MKMNARERVCKVCGDLKEWPDFHWSDKKKTIFKECLGDREAYGTGIFEAEGYN